jgi:hypothetical protein
LVQHRAKPLPINKTIDALKKIPGLHQFRLPVGKVKKTCLLHAILRSKIRKVVESNLCLFRKSKVTRVFRRALNIFSLHGEPLGLLSTNKFQPFKINGLWALVFDGPTDASPDIFYFTVGPNHEQNGLFGSIEAYSRLKHVPFISTVNNKSRHSKH